MGDSACQVIIIEGENALATVNIFSNKHPQVETAFLIAAIEASCEGIHHASLYFLIEDEEDKLNSTYTQPIIDLHNRIINELPEVISHEAQVLVDELSSKLFTAIRKTKELFS